MAGSAAWAGTYFMPSSESEQIMGMVPELTNGQLPIVVENVEETIEQVQPAEEKPDSIPAIEPVNVPAEPVTTPKVNEPLKPSQSSPATNAIKAIPSSAESTEIKDVVSYDAGEIGGGTWSDGGVEAIPHDAPLS